VGWGGGGRPVPEGRGCVPSSAGGRDGGGSGIARVVDWYDRPGHGGGAEAPVEVRQVGGVDAGDVSVVRHARGHNN